MLRSPVLQTPVGRSRSRESSAESLVTGGAVSQPAAETTQVVRTTPSLEDRLGAMEDRMEKGFRTMRGLIREMLAALKKQPNISKVVKDGLPALEEALDDLEDTRRACAGVRRGLPRGKPATKSCATQTAPVAAGSVQAPPMAGKRGATSPPLPPQEVSTKKRKEELAPTWTVVVRKGKGAKAALAAKKEEEPREEKAKRRKKKKKAKAGAPQKTGEVSAPAPTSASNRPAAPVRKAKPEAVILKPAAGKTFADVLSTVRKAVNPDSCGVRVKAVRQTRTGEVLLELGRSSKESRAAFSEALKGAVGAASSVRQLVPRATLEIRELDACTTKEEVTEALRRALGDYGGRLQVGLTRPNGRGLVMAIIETEETAAAALLRSARVRVGWVDGKIRRRVVVPKCFKCLGYGHQSQACGGPDRSKLCFRCGSEGHNAKTCVASPVCFLCPEVAGKTGSRRHMAGSGECGVFRKALADLKAK